ncbi:hypothetical protein COO60DRAFT_485508 [Scenedesmus sp. NREL 46B-D3]|nr:hypothetical protein COO60DRAFT_485508 [Scenedesmus sp. NREL 46B-D3]
MQPTPSSFFFCCCCCGCLRLASSSAAAPSAASAHAGRCAALQKLPCWQPRTAAQQQQQPAAAPAPSPGCLMPPRCLLPPLPPPLQLLPLLPHCQNMLMLHSPPYSTAAANLHLPKRPPTAAHIPASFLTSPLLPVMLQSAPCMPHTLQHGLGSTPGAAAAAHQHLPHSTLLLIATQHWAGCTSWPGSRSCAPKHLCLPRTPACMPWLPQLQTSVLTECRSCAAGACVPTPLPPLPLLPCLLLPSLLLLEGHQQPLLELLPILQVLPGRACQQQLCCLQKLQQQRLVLHVQQCCCRAEPLPHQLGRTQHCCCCCWLLQQPHGSIHSGRGVQPGCPRCCCCCCCCASQQHQQALGW